MKVKLQRPLNGLRLNRSLANSCASKLKLFGALRLKNSALLQMEMADDDRPMRKAWISCAPAGPGAIHDVNGAAAVTRSSGYLILSVILLHLLKF